MSLVANGFPLTGHHIDPRLKRMFEVNREDNYISAYRCIDMPMERRKMLFEVYMEQHPFLYGYVGTFEETFPEAFFKPPPNSPFYKPPEKIDEPKEPLTPATFLEVLRKEAEEAVKGKTVADLALYFTPKLYIA